MAGKDLFNKIADMFKGGGPAPKQRTPEEIEAQKANVKKTFGDTGQKPLKATPINKDWVK